MQRSSQSGNYEENANFRLLFRRDRVMDAGQVTETPERGVFHFIPGLTRDVTSPGYDSDHPPLPGFKLRCVSSRRPGCMWRRLPCCTGRVAEKLLPTAATVAAAAGMMMKLMMMMLGSTCAPPVECRPNEHMLLRCLSRNSVYSD